MKTHAGFKEWASVCRALGRGRQTVLLRKGGIVEEGGGFKPDRSEFLLLPTYLHQEDGSLKPRDRHFLAESQQETPTSDVFVTDLHAVVIHAEQVRSLEALERIRETHVWSDGVILERYRRWRDDSVWALIVRVWRLPERITIPVLPEYQGCKSWVDFPEPVSIAGAVPVLSDDEFTRRRGELLSSLNAANPDR